MTRITASLVIGLVLAGTAPLPGTIHGPHGRPTARTLAADAPRVVVMVHGFQGLLPWSRGFRCSDGLLAYDEAGPPTGRSPRAEGEFGRLAQALAGRGYDVYFARWTTHGSQTTGLRESGECLAGQIAEARKRAAARAGAPAARVTLVAHSMGGLVSRAYIEDGSYPSRGDVEQLVTFGTPHLGVAPDVLLRLLAAFNPASIPGGLLPCTSSPGICELSYEAVAAFNRGHKPRPGVSYHLVAGDKPIYPFSWFVAGADDGVVEAASAAGLPVARWRVNDSHAALTSLVGDYYANSDESVRCLETALGLAGGQTRCTPATGVLGVLGGGGESGGLGGHGGPSGRSDPGGLGGEVDEVVAAEAGPGGVGGGLIGRAARPPLTPMVAGRLDPGASASHPVMLDGTPGMLVLGRAGGRVEPVLELPDGRRLHPMPLGAGPPGAGPFGFRIAEGVVGTARLTLRNAGSSSADYAFFAAFASPIAIDVDLVPGDGVAVAPGARTSVSARLTENGRGIPGGLVEAEWREGERPRRLALVDLGDGWYQAELAAPPLAGLYHVVVRGRAADRLGRSFERESGRILVVGDDDEPGQD